jgi:hypothetical protein
MAESRVAKTTTYGIVAAAAPIAVIFRRGPTRVTRMLRWDLATDEVRGGQWLRGAVDLGPSALSPNGELVLYAARQGPRTYTALSRPPYFTALAFWENGSGWTGGGFFASDRHLVLGLRYADPYIAGTFPEGFEITDVWSYFVGSEGDPRKLAELLPRRPEARQGWTREGAVDHKRSLARPELTLERTRLGPGPNTFRVVQDGSHARELPGVDWADWAPDGTLVFGERGALRRAHVPRDPGDPITPRVVSDLSDQRFERIVAPDDALRWPPPSRFARRARASRR